MGLFSSKTPAEVMRENKRMLDRSIRELDRERAAVEAQERKTIGEMKKMARAGQEVPSSHSMTTLLG
jgi:charged multivesicular body protein 2A